MAGLVNNDITPNGQDQAGAALAQGIVEGSLERDEVLSRYLAAIDAREPEIKAFAHFDRDRFGASPTCNGPLAGLPVGIKDIIDTIDMPTACGSPIYRGCMPPSDAPIVSMVKRAGGVIAGKTVTTEFAAVTPGATRNPHNTEHTPGGSSSGSAAAVAAGFVPFSIGTQTAGSVIRPASFCGVAGLKPSFGLLPGFRVKGFSWTLDTLGLFARTVRDVAFFANAITGQNLSIAAEPLLLPRFGVARMQVWDEIDTAMADAVELTCYLARSRGASVETLAVDEIFEQADKAQYVVQDYELVRSLAFEFDNHKELLSPSLREMIVKAQSITTERYVNALAVGRAARLASSRLFAQADFLIAPAASSPAPLGLESTGSPNVAQLWTLLGLPAVNVPGLQSQSGLPLGIQLIGPLGQDRATLRAAAWLEDALASAVR